MGLSFIYFINMWSQYVMFSFILVIGYMYWTSWFFSFPFPSTFLPLSLDPFLYFLYYYYYFSSYSIDITIDFIVGGTYVCVTFLESFYISFPPPPITLCLFPPSHLQKIHLSVSFFQSFYFVLSLNSLYFT